MSNKPGYPSKKDALVEDLDRVINYEIRERSRKQTARFQYVTFAALGYTLLISVVFSIYSVTKGQITFLNNAEEQPTEVYNLTRDVGGLKASLERLEASLQTGTTSTSYLLLDQKINDLGKKQRAIEETILVDADKAITARLLREKQESLAAQMTALNNGYSKLNDKLDYVIYTVVIVPILGFLGWFIKEIFKKYFPKKSSEE